jgi:hypothetical protein
MNASIAAASLHELFKAEGLPLPPIDDDLLAGLVPLGDHGFATARWSEGHSFETLPSLWLADPQQWRAHVTFSGHGLVSTAVEVALVGPLAGLFVRRQWSAAHGEEDACRQRITGAFALLAQLRDDIAAAQAAGRFPADLRLILVDDDFESQRFGWVPVDARSLSSLPPPQSLAYLAALAEVDSLAKP